MAVNSKYFDKRAITNLIFLITFAVISIAPSGYAQSSSGQKDEISIPPLGIGIAAGLVTGDLGDHSVDGVNFQYRLAYLPLNIYPLILAFGLDTELSLLNIETQNGDLDATNVSVGPWFGGIIPLDRMIPGLPNGLGIPVYIGYNFFNRLTLNNTGAELDGQSLKFAAVIPLPIKIPTGIFFSIQFQYEIFFYDDDDEKAVAGILQFGDELDRSEWQFRLQRGVPFVK